MRCSRKLAFATPEQAERTAAIIRNLGLRDGSPAPKRIYECECGMFHFTSMTESEYRGVPAESGAARCSREGCNATGTYHCDGCGRPVCFQHVKMSGPLGSLRHACGLCDAEPNLPAGAPPLPQPPVVAGPFAKVETAKAPARQPWVRERRLALVTRTVDVAPPLKPKAPEAKSETPQQRHAREVRERDAAKKKQAADDYRWLKNRLRDVYRLVADHRPLEALGTIDALTSLPSKMHPGDCPEAAERFIATRVKEKLEVLQGYRFTFPHREPEEAPADPASDARDEAIGEGSEGREPLEIRGL